MKYADFLKEKRSCPFDNPAPKDVVVQNDTAFMTYALAPYHPDHLLVIPKRHVMHFFDLTPQETADIMKLQKLGWQILDSMGYSGVSFVLRQGPGTGGTVEHLHHHLIPNVRLGDMDHNGDERKILSPEEQTAAALRLRAALARLPARP